MRAISVLCLLYSISVAGQDSPKFEQIAFDFYRDSILTEHPNSKLTLWETLENEPFPFWYPRCLQNFKIIHRDSISRNTSKEKTIDSKGDARFRVKKPKKGRYPKVFVTTSFSTINSQTIVTVVEIDKWEGTTYHIEMDNLGKVIGWCKGGWIE